MTPEESVAARLPAIEAALAQALKDAAGEDMGYVLLIVPVGRTGVHLMGTNIANKKVVSHFLRAAAKIFETEWQRAKNLASRMASRGVH